MSPSRVLETPIVFECQGERLPAILHAANDAGPLGLVLVVGGPQYRVGSHRQFVLLARHLAANGVSVFRFDYRGMGDGEGEARTFADIDDDINAAVNAFYRAAPTLRGVVLWGLCDAASASLFYGYQDERIKGLVLLNPWVYTEQGAAKTYLKHYYLRRLASAELWRKILAFQFDYRESFGSLARLAGTVMSGKNKTNRQTGASGSAKVDANLILPVRLRECLRRYSGPVLLILSGKDLTADEFREAAAADPEWRALLARDCIQRRELPDSDHTFSCRPWRDEVAAITLEWLQRQTFPS